MEKQKKKDCYSCAYKDNVPGSAHIKCLLAWEKSENKPPKADINGKKSGWYSFPFNFDPVWQEEPCKEHSDVKDPDLAREETPFDRIMSILG